MKGEDLRKFMARAGGPGREVAGRYPAPTAEQLATWRNSVQLNELRARTTRASICAHCGPEDRITLLAQAALAASQALLAALAPTPETKSVHAYPNGRWAVNGGVK